MSPPVLSGGGRIHAPSSTFWSLMDAIQPIGQCRVELPFKPNPAQSATRTCLRILGRMFPVPRRSEALTLARTVDETVPPDLPRRLFLNACDQSALLLSGGWNQLDLTPLQSLGDPWTRKGISTLFISMHHGNWEWLAGILHVLRSDSIGVARSAHNPWGQRLIAHVRHFHKTPIFYDEAGYRKAHRTLKHGGLVAFLADQRPPSQGEPGSWLGCSTRVSPLPRRWARTIQPEFWTGHLTPQTSTSYELELFRYPSSALLHWDQSLDALFLPLVRNHPDWHFGFFHKRLVPRETP